MVSTITTQPAMVADELRRQADEFIDLVTLANKVGRDQNDRSGERLPRSMTERRPVSVSAGHDDHDH